eukprot:1119787-Rhodomonas_salina.2
MPGTDIQHRYAMSVTALQQPLSCYARSTPCPVLTQSLSLSFCARPGTDLGALAGPGGGRVQPAVESR